MNTRCKLLVSTLHTLVLVILCLGLSVTNSEAQFGFGGSAASPRDPNKTYDFMYYAPTNENAYFSHKAGRMVWMYGKMDATTGGKDILHLTFMFRPSSQGNLPEGLTWVLTQTGKAPNGTGVLFAYDMTNANGLGDIFGTTGSLAAYSYSSTWGASSGGFENRPFLDSTRIGGLNQKLLLASSVNDVTHGTKKSRLISLSIDVTGLLPKVNDDPVFGPTWGMWLHTFYFPNKKPTWGAFGTPSFGKITSWDPLYQGFYDIFDQPGNERPKEILCANKADTTKYDFSELNGKKIVHNQILTNADFGPFTVKASIETGDAIDVVAFDYNNAPASYQYLGYLGTDVNQEPGLGSHKKQGIALTISDLVQDKNKDGISDTTPAPRSGYLSFYFKEAISPVKVLSLVGVNLGSSSINPNPAQITGLDKNSNVVFNYLIPKHGANNVEEYFFSKYGSEVPKLHSFFVYFAKPGLVDDLTLCLGCPKGVRDSEKTDQCGYCPTDTEFNTYTPNECNWCPNDGVPEIKKNECGFCGKPNDYGKDKCGNCQNVKDYVPPVLDYCDLCPEHELYKKSKDECGICLGKPGYGEGVDECGICKGQDGFGLGPDACDICYGEDGYDPTRVTCATPTPTPTPTVTPTPTPTGCPPPSVMVCTPAGSNNCICEQPCPKDECKRDCKDPDFGKPCPEICTGPNCCERTDVTSMLFTLDGRSKTIEYQGLTYFKRARTLGLNKNGKIKLSTLKSRLLELQPKVWSAVWSIDRTQVTNCVKEAINCVAVSNLGTLETVMAGSTEMVEIVGELYELYVKSLNQNDKKRKKKRIKRPYEFAKAALAQMEAVTNQIPPETNACK